MDSPQNNISTDELINWNTPEMEKYNSNNNYNENYINNPFDLLELKAANNSVDNNLKLNCIKHIDDNFMEDQLNDDNFTICENEEIVIKSKEDYVKNNKDFNKVENKDQIFESALILNQNVIEIEKKNVCSEQEKNLIRKQTRQRILMLIEKEKLKYSKTSLSNSIYCTPQRNCYELSLNKSENIFNRGFIQCSFENNSNNFNKSINTIIDNSELIFSDQDLNYTNLNLLKPEWLDEEFSDFDGSPVEFRINKSMPITELIDSDVNDKPQIFNIGNIKSNHNKFQIYKDDQFQENSIIKPVASSTPTLDTSVKTCTSEKLIKSKCNLSQQSVSNSIDSPRTPLNVTRYIKLNSNNKFNFVVLSNNVNKKNTMNIKKSFQLGKSNSESTIEKIPKKILMNTKGISGLPILKRSIAPFKGKENV